MLYKLDLTTYRCPLPLLMTKKALTQLQQGDELVIELNSLSAVQDFKLLCEQYQYQLQEISSGQLKISKNS